MFVCNFQGAKYNLRTFQKEQRYAMRVDAKHRRIRAVKAVSKGIPKVIPLETAQHFHRVQ